MCVWWTTNNHRAQVDSLFFMWLRTKLREKLWKETLVSGQKSFNKKRRGSFSNFLLFLIWYALKPSPFHSAVSVFSGTLSVHSHDYTCLQAHPPNWFQSSSSTAASVPHQEKQRACTLNFSICTHACVTNAAASEKQRILSPCPSTASSLCAVAFGAVSSELTPHYHCSA